MGSIPIGPVFIAKFFVAISQNCPMSSHLKKIKDPARNRQKITVSVIGGHKAAPKVKKLAYNVGAIIARAGAVLVCGGLDGVMASAAQGAQEAGGLTIGLLPGRKKSDANPYIDIAIPTSIGYARNAIVACSADVIVALPGSHGTSSEICYGLVFGRPVIDLGEWKIDGMIRAKGLKEFEKALQDITKDLP